ncbi:hypothetical protein ACGFYQ_27375 [Streptomyces sp. NPDC048258]|uniref:hypothetical protein n=1 Tax=Streptomyces sp. NPDC048258 TaxID=3365527 RepID=UPI003714EC68
MPVDPVSAAAGAARAGAAALRAAQSASNPYVMVKHGRREDRAAAYDRFIGATTAFYHDGEMDEADVNGLLAALLAIELRAPRHVRNAARDLFRRLIGVGTLTQRTGWRKKVTLPDAPGGRAAIGPIPPDLDNRVSGTFYLPHHLEDDHRLEYTVITSSDELHERLIDFARIARLDVTARWYHSLMTPWGKRWWLKRR